MRYALLPVLVLATLFAQKQADTKPLAEPAAVNPQSVPDKNNLLGCRRFQYRQTTRKPRTKLRWG
jgi:hypothetical protein